MAGKKKGINDSKNAYDNFTLSLVKKNEANFGLRYREDGISSKRRPKQVYTNFLIAGTFSSSLVTVTGNSSPFVC